MMCLIASGLKARRSLCTLCQEAEGEKGKNVIINHVTLMRRTGGERSYQEANAKTMGGLLQKRKRHWSLTALKLQYEHSRSHATDLSIRIGCTGLDWGFFSGQGISLSST